MWPLYLIPFQWGTNDLCQKCYHSVYSHRRSEARELVRLLKRELMYCADVRGARAHQTHAKVMRMQGRDGLADNTSTGIFYTSIFARSSWLCPHVFGAGQFKVLMGLLVGHGGLSQELNCTHLCDAWSLWVKTPPLTLRDKTMDWYAVDRVLCLQFNIIPNLCM